MKLITINDPILVTRKAYVLEDNEQELTDFKPGIDVLPAAHYESDTAGNFYYVTKHEPGERFWKEGGYECVDDYGMKRAFHLDALIIHPRVFKGKTKAKVKVDEDKPKGKRGRPPMDPSLKKPVVEYKPTGGKRGRPKMDPSLKKVSAVYVPTGGKRGRPRKAE
jgi:hypothetical protein